MKTTVTITSKRQLTIPKKIWQKLDLDGERYLEAEIIDGTLKLHKVSFEDQLGQFWSKTKNSVHGTLNDESIKRASQSARKNRLLK